VTPARHRVGVIGARRKRQGTGEYVAREFARCGCDVRAVVGTSEPTIELARTALRQRYGIDCAGFASLAAMLQTEPVDIVAVCSPAGVSTLRAAKTLREKYANAQNGCWSSFSSKGDTWP
jgi:predicted dehydrogenase